MKYSNNMTSGRIPKIIISFSLPVLLGLFFQQIYTAADTAIVSKTLGSQALAAVGCLNSVHFLILGFCNGMGNGFSIPVAHAFGAGENGRLRNYAGNMLWLFLIISAVMTVVSVSLCRTILVITNTPSDIFDMAYTYMSVIFLGIPAQFAYNTLSGVIRSMGDSKNPLFILIFTSVMNVILDLVFIVCFGWGVFGAAFATVLSQAASSAGCLLIIKRNHPDLHIDRESLHIQKEYTADLLKNGLPMGFMVSICGIGSLLLQASVNTLGSVAIAAVTAGERIGQIMQSVTSSLGTTLSVFCGQNAGAKKYDRVRSGVRFGAIISLIYAAAAFSATYFCGRLFVSVFVSADRTELADLAYQYLLTVMAFFWAQTFISVFRFSLQGMGYPSVAVVSSTLEMFARAFVGLCVIPASGFAGACFSNPLAWVSADLFILPAYFTVIRKLRKKTTLPGNSEQISA